MFGRKRIQPKVAEHLVAGWNSAMVASLLRGPTPRDTAAQTRSCDLAVAIAGWATSINKFTAQRVLYGWAGKPWPGERFPCVVTVEVVRREVGFANADGEVPPEPDRIADFLEADKLDRAVARPLRPRDRVGTLVLNGQSSLPGMPSEEASMPILQVRLRLRPSEWTPLRESLMMATMPHTKGCRVMVRAEIPLDVSTDDIATKGYSRDFAVTRYWVDAAVEFGDGALKAHPLYRRDLEAGSLEQ